MILLFVLRLFFSCALPLVCWETLRLFCLMNPPLAWTQAPRDSSGKIRMVVVVEDNEEEVVKAAVDDDDDVDEGDNDDNGSDDGSLQWSYSYEPITDMNRGLP